MNLKLKLLYLNYSVNLYLILFIVYCIYKKIYVCVCVSVHNKFKNNIIKKNNLI